MKLRILSLFCFSIFAISSAAAEDLTPAFVNSLNSHVVLVETEVHRWPYSIAKSQGSGVILNIEQTNVAKNRKLRPELRLITLITNYHVIADSVSATVTLQSGYSFSANIAAYDTDLDIAVLRALVDIEKLPPAIHAPIGVNQNPQVGIRSYTVGAPRGLAGTIAEGLVSSLRILNGKKYIQTTAPASPGSSGGGLFDSKGLLLGIIVFKVIDGENLNFAIPISLVSELLAGSFSRSYRISLAELIATRNAGIPIDGIFEKQKNAGTLSHESNPDLEGFNAAVTTCHEILRNIISSSPVEMENALNKQEAFALDALVRWPESEYFLTMLATCILDRSQIATALHTAGPLNRERAAYRFLQARLAAFDGNRARAIEILRSIIAEMDSMEEFMKRHQESAGASQKAINEFMGTSTPTPDPILPSAPLNLGSGLHTYPEFDIPTRNEIRALLEAKGWAQRNYIHRT